MLNEMAEVGSLRLQTLIEVGIRYVCLAGTLRFTGAIRSTLLWSRVIVEP